MPKTVLYLLLGIFIILTWIGFYESYLKRTEINDLNSALGNLFADYCKDKGGLTIVKDVQIYLPEVKNKDDLTMASCRDGDQNGILLINKHTQKVVYYIAED